MERKKSTAIVILNYEAYEETERCINSILEKKIDVAGIVIVDNASGNRSVLYLKEKYSDNEKIKLIRSRKNLGFAKGNNLGIKVARKTWGAEFILLLNSDTIMLEADYLEKMLSGYEQGIGVIQTSALRMNGRYTQKNYGSYDFFGLFLGAVDRLCSYYNVYFPNINGRYMEDKLGPWVSGCDIMLTPDYFNIFQGLYPLTFLYGEEHILAILLRKADLRWKVVEEAHILHAESKSTPDEFKEGTLKKRKMMLVADKNKLIAKILPLKVLRRIINSGKW